MHCFHSSQGRPHYSHVANEETEPQSGHCTPRVTQPVRSGSLPWFRPRHLWPGPWSYGSGPMVHSQHQYQSKASKHLLTCLPDSRAFSGSMLSRGKNLTHCHGPCGPTELCGLISLHSHAFPPIPTPHQCPLHGVAQRNGNLEWITDPSIKFFSYSWVSQPQTYQCFGAKAFFVMGFILHIV